MTLAEMTELDGDRCRAVAAVHHLYLLGLDDDAVWGNWRKLVGRPTVEVKALLANLEGERPELIQTRLTEFGKAAKA